MVQLQVRLALATCSVPATLTPKYLQGQSHHEDHSPYCHNAVTPDHQQPSPGKLYDKVLEQSITAQHTQQVGRT